MGSIKKIIILGLITLSFIACSSSRKVADASDREPRIEQQKNLAARTSDRGSNPVER